MFDCLWCRIQDLWNWVWWLGFWVSCSGLRVSRIVFCASCFVFLFSGWDFMVCRLKCRGYGSGTGTVATGSARVPAGAAVASWFSVSGVGFGLVLRFSDFMFRVSGWNLGCRVQQLWFRI